MACTALTAPIHIVLPDVVTLQGGTAVTLYSPPLHTSESQQTSTPVDDTILSINQDMLLHALVPSINPDISTDSRADLAFDHSKKLHAVAQLSANADDALNDNLNDNDNDNIFGSSSSWEKLTIANKRTSTSSQDMSTVATTSRSRASRASSAATATSTSSSGADRTTSTKRSTKPRASTTSKSQDADLQVASTSTPPSSNPDNIRSSFHPSSTSSQTSSARLVNTSHTRTIELSMEIDMDNPGPHDVKRTK
ncbi:hypothetical protein GGI21_000817 [Coemansia aciculifera]|nr:hypothetical protein GGI21_000817 [Coemansia aciculifera]